MFIDRNARNDDEIQKLLDDAKAAKGTPAAGTSYHDGVRAAVEYLSGGPHPYQQPAFDIAPKAAPEPSAPTVVGSGASPTGTGAAPTTAGGGGTGTLSAPTR